MDASTLLWITLLLPLVGAGVVVALAEMGRSTVRIAALAASVATLVGAGILAWTFPGGTEPFAATDLSWLGPESGIDVRLALGLDGLSIWLFALSALLVVTSVLVSWDAIREQPASFYALLLLLETGMLGVFAARDIILFYIFFEFTLIPLFFLIGQWGHEERRRSPEAC